MNKYTFEKRDFTSIDTFVGAISSYPYKHIIDDINTKIDIDYISNSDRIENIGTDRNLLYILHDKNLKVLRSYPYLITALPCVKSKQIGKIKNYCKLDEDEAYKYYADMLRETGLVVFNKTTNEEYFVKTTGHLVALTEAMRQAKRAKNAQQNGEILPLTAEFISDNLNRNVLGQDIGRYRSAWYFPIVGLKGVDWCIPGGDKVDEAIESLLDWYNNSSSDLHPIERAAIFHAEFIRIHPFADGNGRTGRLLVNYELVKNGYPTITIKAKERQRYTNALNKAILEGDATDLIDLFIDSMGSTIKLYTDNLLHASKDSECESDAEK